ncbi:hypothetical protein Tco_0258553, partial [Tanacetum coccineum]
MPRGLLAVTGATTGSPDNGGQRRQSTVANDGQRRRTTVGPPQDHRSMVVDRQSTAGSGGSWAGSGSGPGPGRVGSGSGLPRGATCQPAWHGGD